MSLPATTLQLSRAEARKFMLAHHFLWPPRSLQGKRGLLRFVDRVGCIQYDPISVVGRNPDLVLQSRISDYRPRLLHELLYEERTLVDGFDKVASIYAATDWPFFWRRRDHVRSHSEADPGPAMQIAPEVLEAIRSDGPKSPLDFRRDEVVEWAWGQPTRLTRAALELLYAMGELVVFDRVGTRRTFEIARRALPAGAAERPDPHPIDEDYHDWHVLRRVGGLGIANSGGGDRWLGITGVQTPERRAAIGRLVERGELTVLKVEGVKDRTLIVRTRDLPTLERHDQPRPQAAFIAALDNLTWDRAMLRWLFDFDYTWEVYKPKAQRLYGYYVLPVLYGTRFVARAELKMERETQDLILENWWWEPSVQISGAMRGALRRCLRRFMGYLEADAVRFGRPAAQKKDLEWARNARPG